MHCCIKKFQCDTCEKEFTQLVYLLQHKLIQAGIKNTSVTFVQKHSFKLVVFGDKLMHVAIKKYHCRLYKNIYSN